MNKTEIIELLDSLRLPEEPAKDNAEVSDNTKENKETENLDYFLNDPAFYGDGVPYLKYDSNDETIISRTARRINAGVLNPFEVNWMDVTIYLSDFVRKLLELIESVFVMDVAQAIEDEENRHNREDGYYTDVISYSFGTGQRNAHCYTYTHNNYSDDCEYISPISIATEILETRSKAEAYKKKVELHKSKKETETLQEISNAQEIIEQLQKERDEWKRKYEEAPEKEPEVAFNYKRKTPCFTSSQMGIFITGVAILTEENPPGKTTFGKIVERIAGYSATTASENMKGEFSKRDTEIVANAIEDKLPTLAAKIRKM